MYKNIQRDINICKNSTTLIKFGRRDLVRIDSWCVGLRFCTIFTFFTLSRVGERRTATTLHAQFRLFDFCVGV